MTDDEKEYARALERSLTSIENCAAEMVASLEKLRATNHTLIGKFAVLDDIANQLAAVTSMADTMRSLVPTVGRLIDRVDRLEEQRG